MEKQPGKSYLSSISRVKCIILGIDPYRDGDTEIPFHKEDWNELFSEKYSFCHVLKGFGLTEKDFEKFKPDTREVFFRLAEDKGIGFLNVSYKKIEAKVRKEHSKALQLAMSINREFFQKSGCIICCGRQVQKAMRLLFKENEKFLVGLGEKFVLVRHPSRMGVRKVDVWLFENMKTVFNNQDCRLGIEMLIKTNTNFCEPR